MSVSVMAGVWQCGPADEMSAKFLLVAIADNADDFGFACPSQDTLAGKISCDKRTVQRWVDFLEEHDWLRVLRKAVHGKGNLYWVNMEKIGVNVSPMAKQSPLISRLLKLSGVNLPPIFWPKKSGDSKQLSGDNPQPTQTTDAPAQATAVQSQATKTALSDDTGVALTVKNHQEPSDSEPSVLEPSGLELPPTPKGVETDSLDFAALLSRLKHDLAETPLGLQTHRFKPIRDGVEDFDACFRDAWFVRRRREGGMHAVYIGAADPHTTEAGCARYAARLEKLACGYFRLPRGTKVQFKVLDLMGASAALDEAEHNPAA